MSLKRLLGQDVVAGIAVVGVAGFAFWLGRNLPAGAGGGTGPGTLPKALALLLALLGAALAAKGLLAQGRRLEGASWRGPLCILGALVVFGLAVRPLGLAVAGPLAIVAGAFASSEVRWGETLAFGGLMTLFCIALFKVALGLPIPLAPWLIGY